jgi:hypothetical protein
MEFSAPVMICLGIMAVLCILSALAIWKYPQVDDVVKVMSVLTGVFGAVIGSAGSYFFTREPLAAAQRQAASYKQDAEKLTAEVHELRTKVATYEPIDITGAIIGGSPNAVSVKAAIELADLRKDVASLRKSIDSNSAATQKSLASLTEQAKIAAVSFAPRDLTMFPSYTAGQRYVGVGEPPYLGEAFGYKIFAADRWSLPPCRN